jgi:hypothetical protein
VAAVVWHVAHRAPSYDTRGARIVRYTLTSKLLARRLHEIAVVPAGADTSRPLLVLLHGRHDPSPLHWLTGTTSGPESMLSDALFDGLAQLAPSQRPVIVILDGAVTAITTTDVTGRGRR